ncbi:MAG: (4Fe-4S)-binding protein [Bacteroidales bacterium]|nr:(4Fe-4S)-binding protein [Bacteroidales bacterium]
MEKNDRDYSNGEITVHWRPAKCVHSTICYSKLRKVFDPARRPWINIKGASTDEIIEIVEQCPTDALTFTRNNNPEKNIQKKEEKIEVKKNEDSSTKIQIIHNGPALISGNFTITDINGSKLAKANNIALCRCGKSSSMPFCDGTHNKLGFKENRE